MSELLAFLIERSFGEAFSAVNRRSDSSRQSLEDFLLPYFQDKAA